MFNFQEGASVALKNDNLPLGLPAGATGTVWALYATQPPAYEVTFSSETGAEFDALMYEDELTPAPPLETEAESSAHSLTSA